MATVFDVANYFINLASQDDENDLTNLKLQKLLFIAQGIFLVKKEKLLFHEKILAWDLGPVIREVYDKYKKCGCFPITVFDIKNNKANIISKGVISNFLDSIWQNYSKYSASFLVNWTHKTTSWIKAYQTSQKIISIDEMKKDFKNINI